MKTRLRNGLVLAFGLCVIGFSIWNNVHKPRVLILQSYDPDYPWTRDINTGLRRVLDGKKDWAIRWYYMDTKRQPWPEYKRNIGIVVRRMVDAWRPDVIIAVDDDAQEYVGKYYCNDPHIKIIFSGVNLGTESYGYDKARNVTGLLERQPLADVKDAILAYARLRGRAEELRIAFIDDQSETVRGDESRIRTFPWAPLRLVSSELVSDFEAYQRAVRKAQKDADIILTSVYRGLQRSPTNRSLVPPTEVVKWVNENATIPMIGSTSFHAEDGGMLAIGTSPFEQGEVPAKLAMEILDQGRKPSELPVQESRQFVVAMRQREIARRDFRLPRVYEAAARSVNKFYP
jgi:ABC-type uncharacterized transport system substrate-binding protein